VHDSKREINVHIQGLWRLAETIGAMMEPEGSVSPLAFHHPEGRYFSLTPEDTDTLERRVRAAEGA